MKHLKGKSVVAMAMAAVLALTLAACGSDTSSETSQNTSGSDDAAKAESLSFKLAENQPDGNPITEGMKKFAELAKEYTDGTVNIEVYANAALCDEASSIDQLQAGSLDFSRVNTNTLAPVVEDFGVLGMPYLFNDQEHKYRALDGEAGDTLKETLVAYNLVGLDYYEAGARCFYTSKKPIESVEDLKGMKIRVQPTEVSISMV